MDHDEPQEVCGQQQRQVILATEQRDERMANLTQTWLLHFLQQPLNMVLLKEKHRSTKWLSTSLDMIISA